MNMTKLSKRNIILAFVGTVVLGVGIGMMAKVGLGTDSLSACYVGISNLSGLSLGTVSAYANAILIALSLFLYKKNVGPATVLFMLISKWPIDFAQTHMIHSDNLFVSIVLCLLSVVIIALGCELFILSDLGAESYTAFTMGIGKRLKHEVKYVYIRYVCDGLLLVLALIVGGKIGIGTVISWTLMGTLMKMWQGVLEYILK